MDPPESRDGRRYSILKKKRAASSNFNDSIDDNIQLIKTRRVSFAANNMVKPFKAGQENATIWDASYEVTAASAASSEDSAGTTNLHSNFTYSNVTDNTNVASSYIPNDVELQDNKENVQDNDASKRSEKPNKKLNETVCFKDDQMEITEDITSIVSKKNIKLTSQAKSEQNKTIFEDDMELTKSVPPAMFARLIKNKAVFEDNNKTVFEDGMELTELIPESDILTTKYNKTGETESNPQTLLSGFKSNKTVFEDKMELTESVTQSILSQAKQNKIVSEKEILSRFERNRTVFEDEMELTESVTQAALSQAKQNNIDLNDEILSGFKRNKTVLEDGMELTESVTQAILSQVKQNKIVSEDKVSSKRKKNVTVFEDGMELTKSVTQAILPQVKPAKIVSEDKISSEFKRNKTGLEDGMELTESVTQAILSQVKQNKIVSEDKISSKRKKNQTVFEDGMELTKSVTQAILPQVKPVKIVSEDKISSEFNRNKTVFEDGMELTKSVTQAILPQVKPCKNFSGDKIVSEFKGNKTVFEDGMEITESVTQAILSQVRKNKIVFQEEMKTTTIISNKLETKEKLYETHVENEMDLTAGVSYDNIPAGSNNHSDSKKNYKNANSLEPSLSYICDSKKENVKNKIVTNDNEDIPQSHSSCGSLTSQIRYMSSNNSTKIISSQETGFEMKNFQMTPGNTSMDDTDRLIHLHLCDKQKSVSDFTKILQGDFTPSFHNLDILPLSKSTNESFPLNLDKLQSVPIPELSGNISILDELVSNSNCQNIEQGQNSTNNAAADQDVSCNKSSTIKNFKSLVESTLTRKCNLIENSVGTENTFQNEVFTDNEISMYSENFESKNFTKTYNDKSSNVSSINNSIDMEAHHESSTFSKSCNSSKPVIKIFEDEIVDNHDNRKTFNVSKPLIVSKKNVTFNVRDETEYKLNDEESVFENTSRFSRSRNCSTLAESFSINLRNSISKLISDCEETNIFEEESPLEMCLDDSDNEESLLTLINKIPKPDPNKFKLACQTLVDTFKSVHLQEEMVLQHLKSNPIPEFEALPILDPNPEKIESKVMQILQQKDACPKTSPTHMPLSINEKILEMNKTCCNLWKIEDLKNYKFSTFRGAVDINCKIDENTGIVLFLQIKPNQEPPNSTGFTFKLFMEKLHHNTIKAALGSKYTILSLLDYIRMSMESAISIFDKLLYYEANYFCTFLPDMRISLQFNSVPLASMWIIEINCNNLGSITENDLKVTAKVGKVKTQDIFKLVKDCRKGFDFLNDLIGNVENYKKRLESIHKK